MAKIAKRVAKSREGIDRNKAYGLSEAIQMLKDRSSVKFDETVEVSMNLGVDPRHADQMVRGVVNLPNGTGRTVRVAVFARGDKAEEAKAAGADLVGAEDLVETVQKGEINFDRCIATPDMMPLVGRLGKVLGPRGMMPNPKVGTVTPDVAAAVKASKGGAVEFRVEKAASSTRASARFSSTSKALERTSRLRRPVTRAKRAAPRATTSRRWRCPRPWGRAAPRRGYAGRRVGRYAASPARRRLRLKNSGSRPRRAPDAVGRKASGKSCPRLQAVPVRPGP